MSSDFKTYFGFVVVQFFELGHTMKSLCFRHLRTFARKSSNIDFFIKLLLQLGYELLLSEMQKN